MVPIYFLEREHSNALRVYRLQASKSYPEGPSSLGRPPILGNKNATNGNNKNYIII